MTSPEPDLNAARDDLMRAVQRLEGLISDAAEQADVALLRSIAQRLTQEGAGRAGKLQSYDPVRFRRLLELAGPHHATELLSQLQEDLRLARNTADGAARNRDWKALRGASHVLISLTGSVGALSLQGMSERLNAASHCEDGSLLPVLMPSLLQELDALMEIIAATPPPQWSSP